MTLNTLNILPAFWNNGGVKGIERGFNQHDGQKQRKTDLL